MRRAARWLKEAGALVPEKNGEPAAVIEISPLYATTAEQLRERSPKLTIREGDGVYVE